MYDLANDDIMLPELRLCDNFIDSNLQFIARGVNFANFKGTCSLYITKLQETGNYTHFLKISSTSLNTSRK